MPIDTSMYGQLRPIQIDNPLDTYARVAGFQAAQQQNKLAELTLGEKQRSVEQENALSQLYKTAVGSDGQIDRNKLYTGAAQTGLGAKLPGIQKGFAEMDKASREADKEKLAAIKQSVELQGQLLGSVTDANSYTQALQVAAQSGMDVSKLPQQYDPNFVQQARQRALTAAQQVEQEWKQKGYDLEVSKFGYQQKNDAANRSVTMRGQDMSQSTAMRGQNMADARAGERLAFDKTQAATSKGNASEDERKAAGWVSQAENAWANMQGVMKGNPGAIKPGRLESIASALPGDAAANMTRSADRQKFVQASSSLSEALLRAATGAGVNAYEAQQKVAEITPQVGDKQELIDQKLRAIPMYIESLKLRAGRALPKATAQNAAPAAPASPSVPAGAIKFLGFE